MTLAHSPDRTRRRLAALTVAGLVLAGGLIAQPALAAETGTTYYVDAITGNDDGAGTSEGSAWKSLAKVNSLELAAGDEILLRRGSVWADQQLTPQGSGIEGDPITIDAYGQGAKPRIEANGVHPDGLRLWNADYWEIRNLDISNTAFVTDPTVYNAAGRAGDFRGIHIGGDDGRAHHHFVIDAVDVHDITGEVKWIGQRTGYTPPNGISFGNGWDRSKNTGGILITGDVVDITNPGPTATTFHDIVIQNSSVINTSFGAITIKQYTGDAPGAVATGWGDRASESDTRFSPHTDIIIRDNYITQAGTAYGANGIYVTGSEKVVVERNLVERVGTCGIESYNTDDVVIQHNEVNFTTVKAGGQDSNAIDTDIASTNQIVQHNYVYGNGEGMLVYQQRFGDAIFRYNVIAASTKNSIHIASESIATGQIYNNTILDSIGYVINGNTGKYTLRNNIFASSTGNAVSSGGSNLVYAGNLYSGVAPRPNETAPFVADPGFTVGQLAVPVVGTVRAANLDQVLGLIPKSGGRAVNAASVIADNGGLDYRGAALYQGAPDFGAFEYTTPEGQQTETIVGTVTTAGSGTAVPGAVVTADGAPGSATTGVDGWYSLGGVPFGSSVRVDVARTGFAPAHADGVVVAAGTSSRADIALTATATTGTIAGRVVDANTQPLAGAQVSLQNGSGAEIATSTTSATGAFSLEAAVGSDYTIVVSSPGYLSAVRTAIRSEAALETAVGTIILSGRDVHYEAIIDFESFAPGSATNVAPLVASQQNGTVTVAEEDDNQFARLTRTSGSGSSAPATSLTYTAPAPLTGVVTVEQKVRRSSGQPSTQFFGAPYIRNAAGQNLISVGMSGGNISAYNGGTYLAQVSTYRLDTWVHLKVVIDTSAQTYSLFVDDRAVLQNARLRNPIGTGVSVASNYADGVNRGTLDIDDFRVAKGIGYGASETTLGELTVTPGALEEVDATRYRLTLDPGTASVVVKASALSPFARSVTVDGVEVPTDGSGVHVDITGETIPVVVTAEDGSSLTYTIIVRKPTPLADDTATAIAGETVTVDVLANDGPSPALRAETLTLMDGSGAEVAELVLPSGTFRVIGGTVVFAASTDGAGQTATVKYRVENASGATSTATLSVTVNPAVVAAPAWTASKVYLTGDEVTHQGRVFIAQWWTQNQAPDATATGAWAEVGAATACTAGQAQAWTKSWVYTGGEVVVYDGQRWRAQWWTRNQAPRAPWGPWLSLGAC